MRLGLGDAKKVGESAYRQIVAGAMFGGPKGGESFGGFGKGVPKGAAPTGGLPTVPPPAGVAPASAAVPVPSAPKGAPFGGFSSKFDLGLEEKVRWNCAKGDPVRFAIYSAHKSCSCVFDH
jgi:hypothetical protein